MPYFCRAFVVQSVVREHAVIKASWPETSFAIGDADPRDSQPPRAEPAQPSLLVVCHGADWAIACNLLASLLWHASYAFEVCNDTSMCLMLVILKHVMQGDDLAVRI